MEPHGRDQPEEEIMEEMIRGETDDITKLFLTDSGEGDESLRRRDRSAEEEVERGLYPSDHGEAADGSGDDNGEADSSGHEEAEVRSMHMYIN